MRKAVRAIIIHNDRLLVMNRDKFGNKYATLPGGNIEIGETPEQALFREVSEETMVQMSDPKLIIIEHAGDPYGDQYIYLCSYQSGEPELHPQSEESVINKLGKNLYQPGWLSLSELPKTTFLSEDLKQIILKGYQDGWWDTAVEITTKKY